MPSISFVRWKEKPVPVDLVIKKTGIFIFHSERIIYKYVYLVGLLNDNVPVWGDSAIIFISSGNITFYY